VVWMCANVVGVCGSPNRFVSCATAAKNAVNCRVGQLRQPDRAEVRDEESLDVLRVRQPRGGPDSDPDGQPVPQPPHRQAAEADIPRWLVPTRDPAPGLTPWFGPVPRRPPRRALGLVPRRGVLRDFWKGELHVGNRRQGRRNHGRKQRNW
jgi:hypothetical protein